MIAHLPQPATRSPDPETPSAVIPMPEHWLPSTTSDIDNLRILARWITEQTNTNGRVRLCLRAGPRITALLLRTAERLEGQT